MKNIDRVVCDPEILGGKPVIAGTRVPVELVLKYLAEEPDVANVLAAFPRLTLEGVKACLAFAQRSVSAEGRAAVASVTPGHG